MGAYKKPLAFGKPLVARRKLGERIGLLIVCVHDWEAGRDLEARSGTARVVVPEDMLPHEMDWSPAVALDCLVVGVCPESVFYAAATMLHSAGAASIWGEFSDGIWRLERCVSKAFPSGFYTTDGPVRPEKLGLSLRNYRDWALLKRLGVYGSAAFSAARLAVFRNIFGSNAEHVQALLDKRIAT